MSGMLMKKGRLEVASRHSTGTPKVMCWFERVIKGSNNSKKFNEDREVVKVEKKKGKKYGRIWISDSKLGVTDDGITIESNRPS